MRAAAAVAVLLVAGAAGVEPAGAHDVDPTVLTVIDEVPPALAVDGVTIQVATSVTTQLLVSNTTGSVLEVLDADGRPFLRIGPGGVEADVASAAWAASNAPNATPGAAGASGPARWAVASREPAWGWFDHRLHPAAVGALDPGETVPWEVPMRYGGEDVVVRGHLERRAVAGGFSSRLVAGGEPFAGVTVQVLDGRLPGLFLRNTGAEPVVVLGAEGEPFARVGPDGAEVNRHSPTWVEAARSSGEDVDGLVADAGAAPEWMAVGAAPTLAWLDERGRYPAEEPPADVLAAGRVADVLEWSVRIEQGSASAEVRAATAWVPAEASPADVAASAAARDPSPGSSSAPWLLAGLTGAVAAGLWWVRPGRGRGRGRRRGPGRAPGTSPPPG